MDRNTAVIIQPVLLLLFDVIDGGPAERIRQLLRVQVFDLTVPMGQRLWGGHDYRIKMRSAL